jgi:hypothetical protein
MQAILRKGYNSCEGDQIFPHKKALPKVLSNSGASRRIEGLFAYHLVLILITGFSGENRFGCK